MEIGPYSSVLSALQTQKDLFAMEAEKAKATAELNAPARAAEQQDRRDTVRETAVAVDVAKQQEALLNIILDNDEEQSVTVVGSNLDAGSVLDIAQQQRRQELFQLFEAANPEETRAGLELGGRISILA